MTDMYFNEPDVLHELLNKGEVYTVRHYPAERFAKGRTARYSKVRFGKVEVETVGDLSDALLSQYVYKLGFVSVKAWKEAIKRQQEKRKKNTKKHDNNGLWVIHATVIGEFDPMYLIECHCGYRMLQAETPLLYRTCPCCGWWLKGATGIDNMEDKRERLEDASMERNAGGE